MDVLEEKDWSQGICSHEANIGILRDLHEGGARGPAYRSAAFTLSYYGLSDGPATVTTRIDRASN